MIHRVATINTGSVFSQDRKHLSETLYARAYEGKVVKLSVCPNEAARHMIKQTLKKQDERNTVERILANASDTAFEVALAQRSDLQEQQIVSVL